MKIRTRLLALLAALVLLPIGALADPGAAFDLHFDANTTGDPTLDAIAELIRVVSVKGTFSGEAFTCDAPFLLSAELTLEDAPRTRTPFVLSGDNGLLGIESPLLGDELMFLNTPALVEFGAKLYNHMGIPANRPALFWPTAAGYAFRKTCAAIQAHTAPGTGARTITKTELIALAEELAPLPLADAQLYYWLNALGGMSGYDGTLTAAFEQLPAMAEALPEDGILVTEDGDAEVWTLGGAEILRMSADAFSLELADLPEDLHLTLRWTTGEGGAASLFCELTQGGEVLLHVSGEAEGLTDKLPLTAPFTAHGEVSGVMTEGIATIADVTGEADGQGHVKATLTLSQGLTVTAEGTLLPAEVDLSVQRSYYDMVKHGLNLFSMNDVTMNEIGSKLAKPMALGMLPLISHVPASTCVAVMDMIEQAGVFALIGSSAISMSDDHHAAGPDEDERPSTAGDDGYDEDDWDFDSPTGSQQYDEDDWDFDAPAGGQQYDEDDWDYGDSDDGEQYEEDDWEF